MTRRLRVAYLAHSLRSDWNNGNAHFLRGLLRSLASLGHTVTALEPAGNWSSVNLETEQRGVESLETFSSTYPDLATETYSPHDPASVWSTRLRGLDVVILHEWNPPELAALLLGLRDDLGFRLLFHDTHHRAYSSPEQIRPFQLDRFDGVLAFGRVLEQIYRESFHLEDVWTLHEAADVSIFHPLPPQTEKEDVVWVGNWGDHERSAEIEEFLVNPVAQLPHARATIYGVRYPPEGLHALAAAHIRYGGYLPNLCAPLAYASARLTVHVPRRHYASTMTGIPTIRVFEALACGIPLISAPWNDTEQLFRPDDFLTVQTGSEMKSAIKTLLEDPVAAREQAKRGLETVLQHHTCLHRARQLVSIVEELLP